MSTTIHLQSPPSPAGPGHVHPCPECHAQRPCDDVQCTHFPELAPADETRRGGFVVCGECELRRAPYVVVELVREWPHLPPVRAVVGGATYALDAWRGDGWVHVTGPGGWLGRFTRGAQSTGRARSRAKRPHRRDGEVLRAIRRAWWADRAAARGGGR